MRLSSLLVCQRQLHRCAQLPALVHAVRLGKAIPAIRLVECEDGQYQIHDGHHRATAYLLAGKAELAFGEYEVCPFPPRAAFGTLKALADRYL